MSDVHYRSLASQDSALRYPEGGGPLGCRPSSSANSGTGSGCCFLIKSAYSVPCRYVAEVDTSLVPGNCKVETLACNPIASRRSVQKRQQDANTTSKEAGGCGEDEGKEEEGAKSVSGDGEKGSIGWMWFKRGRSGTLGVRPVDRPRLLHGRRKIDRLFAHRVCLTAAHLLHVSAIKVR